MGEHGFVWSARFLWYFWTAMLSLPLLLIPACRDFVDCRWWKWYDA